MAWAGFSDTVGLEVIAVEVTAGLDYSVDFALRGSRSDIDRALVAADFTEPTTPGMNVVYPPVSEVDLADLIDPLTGLDTWMNSSGEMVHRELVRGDTPDGAELIHVWAFTT
jgi:hypothetical protein